MRSIKQMVSSPSVIFCLFILAVAAAVFSPDLAWAEGPAEASSLRHITPKIVNQKTTSEEFFIFQRKPDFLFEKPGTIYVSAPIGGATISRARRTVLAQEISTKEFRVRASQSPFVPEWRSALAFFSVLLSPGLFFIFWMICHQVLLLSGSRSFLDGCRRVIGSPADFKTEDLADAVSIFLSFLLAATIAGVMGGGLRSLYIDNATDSDYTLTIKQRSLVLPKMSYCEVIVPTGMVRMVMETSDAPKPEREEVMLEVKGSLFSNMFVPTIFNIRGKNTYTFHGADYFNPR